MKNSVLTGIAILTLTLTTATLPSSGTTNYWDNNGAAAGFGDAGGIWGSEGKWSSDSTGASVPVITNTTVSDALFFGTATDGLATGTITVDSTNQAFRTITFGSASGEITLSNGTLNLAAPSSNIIINNTSNTIASVLAGTNDLQITKEGFALTYAAYLTPSPVSIFPNATLADYIGAGGVLGGGWITGGTAPATAYYFSNNGTTATFQLQADNGGYIKCVKVELTQSGADITAKAVYAKNLGGGTLGYNFDFGGTTSTIATSQSVGGYGVAQTKLTSATTLTLTAENTYSGNTTINGGIFRIGEGGQLGSGMYDGDITNSAVLLYNSTANQVFSGDISGSGTIVMQSPSKTSSLLSYTNFLTATPTVIIQNAQLADCIGATGTLGGGSITGGSAPGTVCFFSNNGTIATWQLQTVRDTPWTKCVKIQLTQSGRDITAHAVYAKYINNGSVIGYNFDTGSANNSTIATSYTAGGYGAAETVINILGHSTLTLSGTNSYLGGTVVNSGRLQATSTANALPSAGGITVNNGGELKLNVTGMNVSNEGGIGNGNPITVNRGGVLNLARSFNAGYSRPVIINGGTLTSTLFENNDGANYINNLTLKNGGAVTGYKMRVGYHSSATITVSGTNACSIPAGITMVRRGTDPLTFNVADVTGDTNPDLTIPGVIRDYDTSFTNMPLVKTGAGTVSLSGVNTHIGTVKISQGTLVLDGNDSLNTGNPIVLSGGTLDMGAFTNNVGILALVSDSAIVLRSGELAFADSSAASWSGTLTVTGQLGEHSIRFGTSDTALTSTQLAAITLNGGSARLTADGYLTEPPGGTIIMIK